MPRASSQAKADVDKAEHAREVQAAGLGFSGDGQKFTQRADQAAKALLAAQGKRDRCQEAALRALQALDAAHAEVAKQEAELAAAKAEAVQRYGGLDIGVLCEPLTNKVKEIADNTAQREPAALLADLLAVVQEVATKAQAAVSGAGGGGPAGPARPATPASGEPGGGCEAAPEGAGGPTGEDAMDESGFLGELGKPDPYGFLASAADEGERKRFQETLTKLAEHAKRRKTEAGAASGSPG